MITKLTRSQLAYFSPLDALNPENLTEIRARADIYSVQLGKYIFRQNGMLKQHFYLLQGEIEIIGKENEILRVLSSDSEASRNAFSSNNPQYASARARQDSIIISIDRDLLDILLTWDQTGSYKVLDLHAQTLNLGNTDPDLLSNESSDWMTRILQTKAFHRIPPANIQAMFLRMEAVRCKAGEVIIKQGDPGDYFYTISDGKYEVSRASTPHSKPIRLASLGPGDSFGEEALISHEARNASVTCLSDGAMMRLSKKDFISLLKEPLLSWISLEQSLQKIATGARWLDVRLPGEYQSEHISGSINIPLIFLRMKMSKLDSNQEYIVYCDTGRRSSAASFLLSEKGFANIHTLENGLQGINEKYIKRSVAPGRRTTK